MSISDINNRKAIKVTLIYLVISCFCALFGAVYERFSHEVYSFFMIYAFAFPLAGGALPFAAYALTGANYPSAIARNLYHAGIATLTVGSIVQGVLAIYGTANDLSRFYWIAGAGLVIAGVAAGLVQRALSRKSKPFRDALSQ